MTSPLYLLPRKLLAFALLSCSLTAWAQNGPWQINVKNVELASFIEEVATITGKTFVVDPRIKGSVSVISDTQLNREGVFDLLLSVLKVQEFSVIENGEIVEIVQSSRARNLAGAKASADEITHEDMWISHVIDAGHLNPSEIVKSLRQLAPQHAQFSAIAESNAVLISDRKGNIDGMLRVVEQLKSAATQKTIVVNLKHTLTPDVVALLQALHEERDPLKVIANEKNNTLLLRGTDTALMAALQSIEMIDQPSNEESNTRVIRLGHAIASEVTEIVKDVLIGGNSQTGSNTTPNDGTDIVSDESLNAVVVRANPVDMQHIAALVKELDQRRPQVLIEAAIVEVDLDDVVSSGVELGVGDADGDSAVPALSTSLNGVLSTLLSQLTAGDSEDIDISPVDLLGNFSSPTIAISQLDPDGFSFAAIINAFETSTYANLHATPSVMVLNNQESNLFVGLNVPFRSGNLIFPNEQSVSGLNPTSRGNVGTDLTVTPSIHEDLSVRMNIHANIGALQEQPLSIGDSGLADIVTTQRTLTTVVVAENQQTIVLGGLIRQEARSTQRRVPILGSIPLMGRLFRSGQDTTGRTMLLIFLRPTVIENATDAQSVTQRKYQEYWEVTIGEPDADSLTTDQLFKGTMN